MTPIANQNEIESLRARVRDLESQLFHAGNDRARYWGAIYRARDMLKQDAGNGGLTLLELEAVLDLKEEWE